MKEKKEKIIEAEAVESLKSTEKEEATTNEFLIFFLTLLQYLTPKKFLTFCIRILANTKIYWIKSLFINIVISKFKINLSEYEKTDRETYENFQEFFTRQIDLSHRPLDTAKVVSPCDGTISAIGKLEENLILQAKGRHYTANSLLGTKDHNFDNGSFMTIYLAPSDYHRVHMPADAKLLSIKYIPGELFSVNQLAVKTIQNLFSVNERAVFFFESKTIGSFAMVMVAATLVSGISTAFTGVMGQDFPLNIDFERSNNLKKGDEFGKFLYGSTVILLFENDKIDLQDLQINQKLKMGQSLIK